MSAQPTFDFRRSAAQVSDGLYVKPILQNYLYDAKWPDFTLYFPARRTERQPDGYFHPSTHPLMTERQLFYYLTADKLLSVPLEYMGTLSVTIGTALHGFVQMCLLPGQAGILVPPERGGTCVACGRPTSPMPVRGKCWEHGVLHEETRTRGHMDGVLNIPEWGMGGWEFKTSNLMKLSKVQDNDIEAYKTKWPQYWAQNQDYMRASGLRQMLVLFMGLGYPWEMREFHVPYDHIYGAQLDAKYRRVLAAAESGTPPQPCCAPRSKEARACFARNVCPIGLA